MTFFLRDPDKLSYVNKDILAIDADVTRYISSFIPTIKGMTIGNEGRMIIRILEAIADMLQYSVDMTHRECNIENVLQLRNAINITKLIGYKREGPAASQVDCTFRMLQGNAPPGGTAIPLWTAMKKSRSPNISFVTIESATILEATSSIAGVASIQGTAVSGEVLTAGSPGNPDMYYVLSNQKVVESQVRIYVGAVQWILVDNLWDSDPGDLHFYITYDEDNYATVRFGDGFFGAIPDVGSAITSDYIYTSGEGYDVGVGEVDSVLGAIAATVGVTNPAASTGGNDGDTTDDIKEKAPGAFSTMWRAVTIPDVVELSKQVTGVYDAIVKSYVGNEVYVYVLPVGGGVASAGMLTNVEDYLNERCVVQGNVTAFSILPARTRIKANIVAWTNKVTKSVLYKWARDAIMAAFVYDQFEVGYGYTTSEVGEVILNAQNGTALKSVDFEMLTRWPRVVKSNPASPDMNGDVQATSLAGYDTWSLVASSTTRFHVMKNGLIQLVVGQVGIPFTSSGGEVTFTLGVTTDTLIPSNTWTFKTSKMSGNLLVDEDEDMSLAESDLEIHIYYPGEYDSTT